MPVQKIHMMIQFKKMMKNQQKYHKHQKNLVDYLKVLL